MNQQNETSLYFRFDSKPERPFYRKLKKQVFGKNGVPFFSNLRKKDVSIWTKIVKKGDGVPTAPPKKAFRLQVIRKN